MGRPDPGLDEGYLVVVHGLGGLGKTSLLSRYTALARGEHPGDEILAGRFIVAAADFEAERERHSADYPPGGPPLWRALEGIHAALVSAVRDDRQATRGLEREMRRFRQLAAESSRRFSTPSDDGLMSQRVQEGADALGDLASLAGPGGTIAGKGASHLVKGVVSAVEIERRRRGGTIASADFTAVMRPNDAVAEAFAAGLRELSRQTRPIVLLLDTAEILGDTRIPLLDIIRASGSRCVWTVAMRLEAVIPGFDTIADLYLRTLPSSRLRIVEPSRFTSQDITDYLHSAGLDEAAPHLPEIEALTGGVPLALWLFANLVHSGIEVKEAAREVSATGDVSSVVLGLARRYLVHVSPELGEGDPDLSLIYGLALSRSVETDPDVLGALWDIPPGEVAATQERLARRHDFVLDRSGHLHAEVRRAIRLFLLDPANRVTVRDANRRAAEVLRARAARLGLTSIGDQMESDSWRTTVARLVWHTLWADEVDGMRLLGTVFLAAQPLRPSFGHALLHILDEAASALTDETRTTSAGLHLLFPSSTFVFRIADRLQALDDAPRAARTRSIEGARDLMRRSADRPDPVLASDVDLHSLVGLLEGGLHEDLAALTLDERLRALETADAGLPPPQDP
ncbi:MAG TPA: hypothetical protein VF228_26395, partial [Iamia sp.]